MEEKSSKDTIIDFFKGLAWPGMAFEDSKIACPAGDVVTFDEKETTIDFYYYRRTGNEYGKRDNRPTLVISVDVDPLVVLHSGFGGSYDMAWFGYVKRILKINSTFTKLLINTSEKEIIRKPKQGIIQIPESIFKEVASDAYGVFKKGKSSKNRLETFLINKLQKKYTHKAPKETTTVDKGDFSFMVERFNLKNKSKKKDYNKFLDEMDISSLEFLTEKLIKDEVFSDDFLHSLDEYFIKEKLKDIIAIGREILDLRSADMKTEKAKKVVNKVTSDVKEIKQLENLWQKYFEKYLLYLVFSYKKIYPKVEFTNIDGEKRYPDFIGINHYNGLDIIEIKTHLKSVVTWDASHKNFGFSSELSKAIIQTMNYMDAIVQERFKDDSDAKRITAMTEVENLYHPRGIIIISATDKLTTSRLDELKKEILKRDFTKLRNSLQNIEILTFSEILQIADDYVKNIHSSYS